MTSITRLPTGWPARPVSQPGITCSGDAPMTKPNGEPDDQEEPNAFFVRQMYPVYWAMTYWPLTTVAPPPLMRAFTTSPLGGVEEEGNVSVGAPPVLALTVGRLPPPLDSCVPEADAVLEYSLSKSMTNTCVVVPVTPS